MVTRFAKLALICAAIVTAISVRPALAQQITYYTFDNATGNYSYGCVDPLFNPSITNSLLCFNDASGSFGSGTNPSPQAITYPASLGGGTHTELLMNPPAGSESETVWFSVPQNVANGFTSYFAFRITPAANSGFGDTADGMAFMIQNAQGGGAADSDTGCLELGTGVSQTNPPNGNHSGPNILTGGGRLRWILGHR